MPDRAAPALVDQPPSPAIDQLACRLIANAERFGITRLADITGLDRLGIPVVQAVRPQARSNSVAQGKGRSLAEAAVSAILEAVETFFAEQADNLDAFETTAVSLGMEVSDFALHLRPDAPPDWRERRLSWVWGEDLASGRRNPIPLEMVHTCWVLPPIPTDGVFFASTTGLAASPDHDLAVRHGLLEVVERAAVARAEATHGFFHDARVDGSTITCPDLAELLELIAEQDFLVGIWAMEGAGGIPVIWCQLLEGGEEPLIMPYASDGFAAHPDLKVAIAKGLVEAAQSRLAAISGSRDDITRAVYPTRPDWEGVEAARRLLREGPCPVAYQALSETLALEPSASTADIVAALVRSGIDQVMAVAVGGDPVLGVHCVRVICPQLAPLVE